MQTISSTCTISDITALVEWLSKFGAPLPKYSGVITTSIPSGITYQFSDLQFVGTNGASLTAVFPINPSVVLCELQKAKLAVGDPTIPVPYGTPDPTPANPQPLDSVVRELDPNHPGWRYAYPGVSAGQRYTAADGSKWIAVTVGFWMCDWMPTV